MYDERDWDASLPDTSTEEFLECVHILYKLSGCVDKVEAYKFVDRWMFSECEELEGVVPAQLFIDGEGLIALEYLRDVKLKYKGLQG